jgi:ABC-2 type transport system ATP-binding protein
MEEADTLCDVVAFMHAGRIAAEGPPAELKAALGPHATLNEVFKHFAGATLDQAGSYRDIRRGRSAIEKRG